MGRKKQYTATFTSTMSMVCYGMVYGWPSPSLPKLFSPDSAVKITDDQGSWLSVMPFIGSLIGGPAAAFISYKFGRKYVLLSTSIPYAISWIIIGCSEKVDSMMVARGLAGLGSGALITVLPTYLAEITGPEVRGQLATWFIIMWNLGVLLIYICGPFFTIKLMAFIAISIPVIFALSFVWMPESPYFQMLKGRKEEAKRILTIFRGDEDVDKIIDNIEEHRTVNASVFEVVKDPIHRKCLYVIMIAILVQENSGRAPFLFYCQTIFHEADKNIPAAYISIAYAGTQLISSLAGSLVVDKFGRKPLLYFSCVGSIVTSTTQGIYFFLKSYMEYNVDIIKWLPVICLFLYIISFSVGFGIIPSLLCGELLSTNIKSSGMGIIQIYDALVVTAVTKFFQLTKDYIGVYVPFWTYAVCSALGFVYFWKCLPETKGLSLEQIHDIMKVS